jgi:hypothetical protein
MEMNDDTVGNHAAPEDPQAAGSPASTVRMPAWLPWFTAAVFALLAGFVLAVCYALRAELTVVGGQASLAEIQGRTLRQQIEAERILSARRLADLRGELQRPRDPGRLQVVPLAPPVGVVPGSVAVAMWDPDFWDGQLVVSGLPAIASDKSYQLWLFDSEHPAGTSVAVFSADSASNLVRIPFGLQHSCSPGASFRVSIEPKGGSAAPAGPVVLASR